ncbi:uncharacterized protein ASPGLDRAFT_737347 [Aspergillus glaucus CBS 516.65]|uniref:7-dehydrocholesterol reductase n=1 Tax=Aspergillus glaucus CBS 516.65 TaxID=1160497 RepID=A0A1L9VXT4_ASPGL|nr:hypothetical protein ASPGLDRAFT_737347 [Aspergillus glaucus CBS 516.65]OJJ88738.1 hypothetical protein ASPGLDRAFT_737347 [Aspergillus glaucus CBS 516.65]
MNPYAKMKHSDPISDAQPPFPSATATMRKKHHQQPKAGLPEKGHSSVRSPWLLSVLAAVPLFVAPLITASFLITISQFEGSLSRFVTTGFEQGFLTIMKAHGPRLSLKPTFAYTCYIALQAVLFYLLPGPTNTGQRTPAGYLLTYRTNGLYAWVITHSIYALLCWYGLLDPGFVIRNWSGIFIAMNLFGYLVAIFAYGKAYLRPSHPEDRRFSGSALQDLYAGIELNPRFGKTFDFKFFTNGRMGMISWTLIDISSIAYQHQAHHTVSPSLILVTILQSIYAIDFFINESWYLRTIDITHDHYGFYLIWGCFCFLPANYTLQAQYLTHYPTSPSTIYLAAIFSIGIAGYALFRSVNNQKDRVRRSNGKCLIWGKPAQYITATYKTSDGVEHKSILLCSGWWSCARHVNYVGDLLLSFSMCAVVGTDKLLVWLYVIWMGGLLVHRIVGRCRGGLFRVFGEGYRPTGKRLDLTTIYTFHSVQSKIPINYTISAHYTK